MLFPLANTILTANPERRKQLLRPRITLKFVFSKRDNNPLLMQWLAILNIDKNLQVSAAT